MNATEVGTAFFTTPGVPADRLTALRRAFDAAMKDPDLLAEAQKIKIGVSPMAGEDLQKLVGEVSNLSPGLAGKSPRRLHHDQDELTGYAALVRAAFVPPPRPSSSNISSLCWPSVGGGASMRGPPWANVKAASGTPNPPSNPGALSWR